MAWTISSTASGPLQGNERTQQVPLLRHHWQEEARDETLEQHHPPTQEAWPIRGTHERRHSNPPRRVVAQLQAPIPVSHRRAASAGRVHHEARMEESTTNACRAGQVEKGPRSLHRQGRQDHSADHVARRAQMSQTILTHLQLASRSELPQDRSIQMLRHGTSLGRRSRSVLQVPLGLSSRGSAASNGEGREQGILVDIRSVHTRTIRPSLAERRHSENESQTGTITSAPVLEEADRVHESSQLPQRCNLHDASTARSSGRRHLQTHHQSRSYDGREEEKDSQSVCETRAHHSGSEGTAHHHVVPHQHALSRPRLLEQLRLAADRLQRNRAQQKVQKMYDSQQEYASLTSSRIFSSHIVPHQVQFPTAIRNSLLDDRLPLLRTHCPQYHQHARPLLTDYRTVYPPPSSMNRRPVEQCPQHRNCHLHYIVPGMAPIHLTFVLEDSLTEELTVLLQQFQQHPDHQLHIEIDVIPRSSNTSSIVYWKNGVRHFPPPIINTHHLRNIPFAPVTTPSFDWTSLYSWFNILTPLDDHSKMVAWLCKPYALGKRLAPYLGSLKQDPSATLTRNDQIQLSDLDSFRQQGTIVDNEKGFNSLSAIIFKVIKSGGDSCRMIWDGGLFGELMDLYFRGQREKDIRNNKLHPPEEYEIPKTPLPLIPTLVNEILNPKWKYMSTIDARNMFYQFKILSADLRKLFGIRYQLNNNTILHLLLACLPQGINFSPSFAQHTSLYICRIVKYVVVARCREFDIPEKDFHLTAWIDNFILLTQTLEDRQFISSIFDEVVGTDNILINNTNIGTGVNLQMKPWEHQDDEGIITVLGIKFDLNNKEAAPADDKRLEVNELMIKFNSNSTTTNRTFFQWFGLCQWMVYSTAQLPLCFFDRTMKMVRRICSKANTRQEWDSSLSLDEMLLKEMSMMTLLVMNTSRKFTPAVESVVRIISDASRKAIAAFHDGVVPQDDTKITRFAFTSPFKSSSFHNLQNINQSSQSTKLLSPQHNITQESHPLTGNDNNATISTQKSFTDIPMMIVELFTGYISFQVLPPADTWTGDNIPALRAFSRGHSGNNICDHIIRKWILSGRHPSLCEWVDTNCMLADGISRPDEEVSTSKPCQGLHTRHKVRWSSSPEASKMVLEFSSRGPGPHDS